MKIKNRDLISVADTLDRAAALIVEKGWGRGAFALNELGEEVDPNNDDACNFCAVGAITHIAKLKMDPAREPDGSYGPVNNFTCDLLARYLGVMEIKNGLTEWNDGEDRSQADVVGAMADCAAFLRTKWSGLSWWQRAFGTVN